MVIKRIGIVCVLALLVSGCAITQSGKGFDLVDDNKYAEALPFLEAAAKQEGSKSAAVMASFLYLSDYQIPRDIAKAQEYYELSQSLDYARWDQYLDYFMPLAKARILIYDEDHGNDVEGTNILRGERYSEYSPALSLLAKSYAFGKGVGKNTKIAKLLFERAVDHDRYVYSAHYYAWMLAVHPDQEFRDGVRALTLIQEVLDDDEEADKATTLDTLAAIHAENGNFELAVQTQKKAIENLINESKEYPQFLVWESWLQCRLKSYEQKVPYHYASDAMPFKGATGSEPCVWE
ncbi:tetratricopeptide TPR_2 repeat protein-like protein [Oleiphilus messinensis]|uniref:Tetratricopeptide TPR_2 repeat protein-like protein n=1 Tax=Oleiphilus messinensis TaxID=141451 RepID=A0A1Y0I8A0_9GAMM|nr:sel1 repeat family protein [Oleiphilus messinensis]ARU56419.1 tetratricopeptide TPR_2 repeat protein-like protein [Oleiphilus messinensis]